AHTLALTPDDKIVLAGVRDGNNLSPQYAAPLARLNADGSFDNSFSGDGTELFTSPDAGPEGINVEAINDIALGADGKILLALDARAGAPQDTTAFAATLLSNGSLDTFSEGFESEAQAIAIAEASAGTLVVGVVPLGETFSEIFELSGDGSSVMTLPDVATDTGSLVT